MAIDFRTVEISQKVRAIESLGKFHDHDAFVLEKYVHNGRKVVKVRFADGVENWYLTEWLDSVVDNVVMFRKPSQ